MRPLFSKSMPSRRTFLKGSATVAMGLFLPKRSFSAESGRTTDNPAGAYQLGWTDSIRWSRVVDVTEMPGSTIEAKLQNAQSMLAEKDGGVVFFPAGTYRFSESIHLKNGIVLRGTPPKSITRAARQEYRLGTRFEFPKFVPKFEGTGTPIETAFKGIYLDDPARASHCGVVHLDIQRGHIHLQGGEGHRTGHNRIVFGCIIRNAAVADPSVPNRDIGQHAWQRFTHRHFAAIDVKSQENMLIANNRLPKSGEENFTMNGYRIRGTKNEVTEVDGIVFDYDNRPGIYANHFGIGGAGGQGPDGTPESHPHGFRKGIVIRDNYIYNSGRMGIGFCGDGVQCLDNVIRFPEDVWRPTNTGQKLTTGSSTNDNRAVEMRGWRWRVSGNDYVVHRNWAYDRKYRINDGEGLMHEDHVNSTIHDSVLTNNRGNTYLSLYKTAGIDGLLIEGNEILLDDGRQTIADGAAIFVSADRNSGRYPCRNVRIVENRTSGGGILIAGSPAENNEVKSNRYVGRGKAKIYNRAEAEIADNVGFLVEEDDSSS